MSGADAVALLSLSGVSRRYEAGTRAVVALEGIDLDVERGAFVAVVGPSGCGKSTLLHLCGGMDRPTSGSVVLAGLELDALGDEALARVRRDRIGFVFQSFSLLPTLTALENIALPLLLGGLSEREAMARARQAAGRMEIGARLDHYPRQLSGGEMQRTAIARAVVHAPDLVLADEPTGNLDSRNGKRVLDLLQDLNRESGITILLATHAPDLASAAGSVVHLRDGRLQRIIRHTDSAERPAR